MADRIQEYMQALTQARAILALAKAKGLIGDTTVAEGSLDRWEGMTSAEKAALAASERVAEMGQISTSHAALRAALKLARKEGSLSRQELVAEFATRPEVQAAEARIAEVNAPMGLPPLGAAPHGSAGAPRTAPKQAVLRASGRPKLVDTPETRAEAVAEFGFNI